MHYTATLSDTQKLSHKSIFMMNEVKYKKGSTGKVLTAEMKPPLEQNHASKNDLK